MELASACSMHQGKVHTDVQDLREEKSPPGLLRRLDLFPPGLERCASGAEAVVQTTGEEKLPSS